MSEHCAELQRDIRDLLARLRPLGPADADDERPTLDRLMALLRTLVDGWQHAPGRMADYTLVLLQYDADGGQRPLDEAGAAQLAMPRELMLGLYRLSQEALTNVARHAGARRVELRLAIDLRDEQASLEWSVRDDGIGIADLASAMRQGSGLGGMRNACGRWAASCIALRPNRRAGGLALTAPLPRLRVADLRATMSALKVALADDHAVVRMGYRRLLELEPDVEVVAEFGDADAAYESLTQRHPGSIDLLILDLSMPGRSGLDLLRRLAIRLPSLRVLVFSMHDSTAMVGQCLGAGAAGFVSKSSAPEALIDAVRRVAAGERVVPGPMAAPPPGPYQPPHLLLSPREFDVLHHLLAGHSVEVIAQRLRLSEKTIANYQTQVRQKLGVTNMVELLRYAQEHRLVSS